MPGEALPLSEAAVFARGRRAGEGDGVAAVFQHPMGGVDIEIVEEMIFAAAFEMDKAAVFEDGYGLGINGNQRWRGGLEAKDAPVFVRGDAEVGVVGQGLAGIGVPVLQEPGSVCGDGVIEFDEDGLHVGGDVGADGFVEEFGATEEGVQEGEGGAVGWRLGGR